MEQELETTLSGCDQILIYVTKNNVTTSTLSILLCIRNPSKHATVEELKLSGLDCL